MRQLPAKSGLIGVNRKRRAKPEAAEDAGVASGRDLDLFVRSRLSSPAGPR
jgi:hypothetical protein